MNSYARILATAPSEIRAFAASEAGKHWDDLQFQRFENLAERARLAFTDEEAEKHLNHLLRLLTDSGPMDSAFSPSIDRAIDAMQRREKQQGKRS